MKKALLIALIFAAMFGYCLDTRARLHALTTIVAYGTIPSSMFPDDPRLTGEPWYAKFF